MEYDIKIIFIGIFTNNLNFHKIIQVDSNNTQDYTQISDHKWNVPLTINNFLLLFKIFFLIIFCNKSLLHSKNLFTKLISIFVISS